MHFGPICHVYQIHEFYKKIRSLNGQTFWPKKSWEYQHNSDSYTGTDKYNYLFSYIPLYL